MHAEKASVKIQPTHMIFSETRTKREIFQSWWNTCKKNLQLTLFLNSEKIGYRPLVLGTRQDIHSCNFGSTLVDVSNYSNKKWRINT